MNKNNKRKLSEITSLTDDEVIQFCNKNNNFNIDNKQYFEYLLNHTKLIFLNDIKLSCFNIDQKIELLNKCIDDIEICLNQTQYFDERFDTIMFFLELCSEDEKTIISQEFKDF